MVYIISICFRAHNYVPFSEKKRGLFVGVFSIRPVLEATLIVHNLCCERPNSKLKDAFSSPLKYLCNDVFK